MSFTKGRFKADPSSLEGARDAIKTRYVKFSSGLVYNETGDLVRTRNENELDWVGTPTEEMDKAWENITSRKLGD